LETLFFVFNILYLAAKIALLKNQSNMKFTLPILAAILLLHLNLNGQMVQSGNYNSLIVKGNAILKQTPEIVAARINLQTRADKYKECQEKLVKSINLTRGILLKNGIEEESIRTNDLNVSERRDYLPNGGSKLSFEGIASITIEHTYNVDYAQKLLTALQTDSVTLPYSLEFILSENQKKELRQKAIAVAMADANEKAEAIARAANVRLMKINNITYTDDESGRGMESDLVRENSLLSGNTVMFKSAGQAPAIDFNPKEIGIRKTILVEWSIESVK